MVVLAQRPEGILAREDRGNGGSETLMRERHVLVLLFFLICRFAGWLVVIVVVGASIVHLGHTACVCIV